MTQLVWDSIGERFYETGVDRGVLYVDGVGVPWNGLASVEEVPTGGEARPFYIDGVKYLNLAAREEFVATINAFYSPVEFDSCEGMGSLAVGLSAGQQHRKSFGLSYRTRIGNDLAGTDHGYKIHIVYNALVAPITRNYSSISDTPEVPLLSWPITTKPVVVPGMARSAHLVIDSTKVSEASLNEIETILYGSLTTSAMLPTPDQLVDALINADIFTVTDLGDGAFRISGSLENVLEASPGVFQIIHDTAVVIIDADSATISSA